MPREDRRIYFSHDEIYKAIYALSMQKNIKLPPPGAISAVKDDEKDPAKVIIGIQNPQNEKAAEMDYTRDFLAASLMLFCKGARIPLPKKAQKSVLIEQGQVVLRVEL